VSGAYAGEAGFALVIALTTYLSLVVGELVPKQLALARRSRLRFWRRGPW
jgi:putative hemolysin